MAKVHSIAGVGTMPKMATAEMFRNRPLQPFEVTERANPGGLKGIIPAAGLMPALVPGMVDAALLALREFGSMSLARDRTSHRSGGRLRVDDMRSASIAYGPPFFNLWRLRKPISSQRPPALIGWKSLRQPDLARTLRSMVEEEKKALAAGAMRARRPSTRCETISSRGEIARKIDAS